MGRWCCCTHRHLKFAPIRIQIHWGVTDFDIPENALKIAQKEQDAKGIYYINTIVFPNHYEVYIFNVTDELLNKSEQTNIPSPKTSAGNTKLVNKPVYLLDIKKGS